MKHNWFGQTGFTPELSRAFFGLCPSMCGKAPLFRQVLKTISRGFAADDAR
jgi:hypothetical protein